MEYTLEQVIEMIYVDVTEWFDELCEPMPLSALSKRYYRYCGKLNMRLIDVIKKDSRLKVKTTKKNSRMVFALAQVEAVFGDNIGNFIIGNGLRS